MRKNSIILNSMVVDKILEIIGIPQRDDEDTNSIVIEVAKMMGVKVLPEQISTSHRMPVNPKKNSDQIANPQL